MLPFLKNKQDQGAASSSEVKLREPDDENAYDPMHAAAEDLISAIHSKDIKGVAEALRAAHELHESIYDEGED